ncbi:hypothetical protein MHYP_G00123200 [Metynnis hypsauchen]
MKSKVLWTVKKYPCKFLSRKKVSGKEWKKHGHTVDTENTHQFGNGHFDCIKYKLMTFAQYCGYSPVKKHSGSLRNGMFCCFAVLFFLFKAVCIYLLSTLKIHQICKKIHSYYNKNIQVFIVPIQYVYYSISPTLNEISCTTVLIEQMPVIECTDNKDYVTFNWIQCILFTVYLFVFICLSFFFFFKLPFDIFWSNMCACVCIGMY